MPARQRPLALTMGEPAGIAGEIAVKAWQAPDGRPVPPFAILADAECLRADAHRARSHVHVLEVASMDEAARRFAEGLPVIPVRLEAKPAPGHPDPKNAPSVIASIDRAVALARSGEASGVVTNPLHKATLYSAGFKFPGHTEYLASLCGGEATMMLAVEGLRVVPVTVHVALAEALRVLSPDLIVRAGKAAHSALRRDFGIASPRLAVAALNPHAGEQGTMGDEEQRLIAPSVERLKQAGIEAAGPLPADTLFHEAARLKYDAAICMYHDQALIPVKTLDFSSGVNVTLGLPIVRTSPDHGTALDIAGQNRADPSSLLAALRLAAEIAGRRATAQ